MAHVAKRLDAVEGRLGSLSREVGELRGEVGELRGEVGELRGEVGELRGEVGELRGEVQKLRVLGEENARQITLILEVQDVHSVRLDRITKQLEPLDEMRRTLGSLHDFVRAVAQNHELRIADLERRAGGTQPPH